MYLWRLYVCLKEFHGALYPNGVYVGWDKYCLSGYERVFVALFVSNAAFSLDGNENNEGVEF